MILVDTGPFVALFDPQDAEHTRCKDILSVLRDPLFTTIPVLTEAFHLLASNSMGITQWIWQMLLSLSPQNRYAQPRSLLSIWPILNDTGFVGAIAM